MKKIINISTLLLALVFGLQQTTMASSHREAPLISNDPLADNTDLYAFKSPTDAEKIIREANKPGLSIEAEVIGQRPAGEMSANHPLIQLAMDCLREQGLDAALTTGSTDANIPLSKGYPALVLGVSTGGNAHIDLSGLCRQPHSGIA